MTNTMITHQESYMTTTFLSLPTEVLVSLFTYLSAKELTRSVRFTCKMLLESCDSQPLWREFCELTGKVESKSDENEVARNNHIKKSQDYKHIYFCSPCVPTDFPTIVSALHYYSHVKHRLKSASVFTVTVMPGVYHEQITMMECDQESSQTNERAGNIIPTGSQEHNIVIRAAFGDKGAAIVHYNPNNANQPCVKIVHRNEQERELSQRSIIHITLQNLQFLHFSQGNNIWDGNCCLQLEGHGLHVDVSSCSFQSDSGRGIVVSRGARLHVINTTVHDCAATGIYIGDLTTSAYIEKCNILRNGGGTRAPPPTRRHEEGPYFQEHEQNTNATIVTNQQGESTNNHQGRDNSNIGIYNPQPFVPPGHSGMYLEASTAIVNDCLLSKNILTGLSVVRGGEIKISNCDIKGNGSDPITIEDAHDAMLGLGEGIRGGIADMGGNNVGAARRSSTMSRSTRRDMSDGANSEESCFTTDLVLKRNSLIRGLSRFPATSYDYTTLDNLISQYSVIKGTMHSSGGVTCSL